MWKVGANDRISVDIGKQKKNYFIPLCMWLLSNSVLFLLAVLMGILSILPDGEIVGSIELIVKAARLFLDGMYVWILSHSPFGVPLHSLWYVYLLTPLPVLPVLYLGYVLGLNNIKLNKKR